MIFESAVKWPEATSWQVDEKRKNQLEGSHLRACRQGPVTGRSAFDRLHSWQPERVVLPHLYQKLFEQCRTPSYGLHRAVVKGSVCMLLSHRLVRTLRSNDKETPVPEFG